tara:strand:- start:360 stop:1604 length:1245 start_codon:yes stop_codon:yes gene_type:complete
LRIIYLSKRFLNAFWAVPFVLIIRIIEPVLSIKILFLYSKRIGHFVCDSVLQAIKLEHLPKNVRHIIWFEEPSSNSQWSKMVLRNLPSNPLFENIDYWNRKIPGGEKHSQDSIVHSTSRDTEGLVGRSSFEFSFLEDEEAKALKWLQSFGWKKGEPFVCLIVRDNSYLEQSEHLKDFKVDWSYHSYRNSDISDYKLAIKWLVGQGAWVIRMGKIVSKPLGLDHPRIIDYPFEETKCDLLDIWLFSKCDLCISTLLGADEISSAFRRPKLHINFVPLFDIHSWANAMCVPKKLFWIESGKELNLEEYLKHCYISSDRYEKAGIDIKNLSSNEILESVKECWEDVTNNFSIKRNISAQKEFWSILMKTQEKYHGMTLPLSNTQFLEKKHGWIHPQARMANTWLESRNEDFFKAEFN